MCEEMQFEFDGKPFKVTISVGISMAAPAAQSVDGFIVTADEELYRAKNSGRNRVCVAKVPALAA